jgi:hypothetical protein
VAPGRGLVTRPAGIPVAGAGPAGLAVALQAHDQLTAWTAAGLLSVAVGVRAGAGIVTQSVILVSARACDCSLADCF